jgi:hypothetical protein
MLVNRDWVGGCELTKEIGFMDAHKEQKRETVVGTFKQTREVLPNGDTKEIREEKTITVRRNPSEPDERD